jgi:Domain of unknown function (DUF4402)
VSEGQRRRYVFGSVLLALAGASPPSAAQTINSVAAMSFGSFIAGSGGTVTVTPGSVRMVTGGVVRVGQGGTYAPASFNVSGTGGASYTITLPLNNTVSLSDASSNTMSVNSFASNPPTGLLSGGGAQTIRIGATLTVGNNQPPGIYSGSFNVTVNY